MNKVVRFNLKLVEFDLSFESSVCIPKLKNFYIFDNLSITTSLFLVESRFIITSNFMLLNDV